MNDVDIMALRSELDGAVITRDDDDYAAASTVYLRTGSPLAVARVRSAEDVAEAVRFAQDTGLTLSVRSGGHGMSGLATNDGGLVIDLRDLDDVEVIAADLVRVGAGATWGRVAEALAPHGLAISSGDTSSVGVGGLTLGGGIGWEVRGHGLTLDQLVEATVVTASSAILTVSERHEPELFWALRGGGGNFGVVTDFVFRAHERRGVVAGMIDLDPERIDEALRGWRDAMRTAPEPVNSSFLATPPFGPDVPAAVTALVCFAGDDEAAGMRAVAPLLDLPGVRGSDIRVKPYAELLEEPHPPEGVVPAVMSGLVEDLSDEAIDALLFARASLGPSVLMVRAMGGAINRVSPDATAFAFRSAEAFAMLATFQPLDAPPTAAEQLRDAWAGFAPYVCGVYGNFRAETDAGTVAQMYPPATLERLRAVKRAWDPGNLFDRNQNIAP